MRKLLTAMLIGSLVLTALATPALAGDSHAARNVWAGVGIGVAVATLGGLVLGPVRPLVVAPPAPAVYAPPPVVVYSPRPVVVYRGWLPAGHPKHRRHWEHGYR